MTNHTLTFQQIGRKNWIGMAFVALGVAMFFIVSRFIAPTLGFSPFDNEALNITVRYQVTMLGITAVLLFIWFMLFRDQFRAFAWFGDMQAHPAPVRWLGIKSTDTWRSVGTNFAVIVSLATALFMVMGVLEGDLSRLKFGYIGIAALFAISNSFIEEAITRFGVVVSLHNVVPDLYIALVSGLIFGLPHYYGTPGGPIGAIMAGFLGWLLAKSMTETRGIFWAWFIHFLQDVIIFMVIISVMG